MKKSSKKTITYSLIAIAFISLLVWAASGKNDDNDQGGSISKYSASALETTEGLYDFGTIVMQDGNVTHRFKLKNEGDSPVNIEKIYTSCMCTTASIIDSDGKKHGRFGMQGHGLSAKADYEVAPGESIYIEAVFDPAAHGPSGVGLARRSIYIDTNSQQQPKVEIKFQAIVTR